MTENTIQNLVQVMEKKKMFPHSRRSSYYYNQIENDSEDEDAEKGLNPSVIAAIRRESERIEYGERAEKIEKERKHSKKLGARSQQIIKVFDLIRNRKRKATGSGSARQTLKKSRSNTQNLVQTVKTGQEEDDDEEDDDEEEDDDDDEEIDFDDENYNEDENEDIF